MLQEHLAQREHRQRQPSDEQRRGIRFVQVLDEVPAVLPEAPVRAVKTEQLRQLGAGEEQCHAALEPHHHALRDKIHDDSGPRQPRDERDERHEQRGARGQRAKPRRVAAGHLAERRADEQRDGGRHRDHRVA